NNQRYSTIDDTLSRQTSTAFSPSFPITTRIRFVPPLIVANGNPSIVSKKLPLLSNPTLTSTTDRVSLTSGFGTNFTEVWSDALLGGESTFPASSTFRCATK